MAKTIEHLVLDRVLDTGLGLWQCTAGFVEQDHDWSQRRALKFDRISWRQGIELMQCLPHKRFVHAFDSNYDSIFGYIPTRSCGYGHGSCVMIMAAVAVEAPVTERLVAALVMCYDHGSSHGKACCCPRHVL